jgi:general secretion pathway protein A
VVDEAHRLSRELLEEIRLLLNLETPREKLLQIILAGQPELTDTLRRPDLRQLKQRVCCQCKLNPLSLPELKEYIDHRLARAGLAHQTLFSDAVIQKIYEYTEGIPRLVNTLCDASLRNGFALQAPRIAAAMVDEAAQDLDLVQPPAPDEIRFKSPAVGAPAKEVNGHAATAGDPATPAIHVPLENYAARQKSLNFIAHLMDRWK